MSELVAPAAPAASATPEKRFRVVAIVSLIAYAPFVLAHVYLAYGVIPGFAAMYRDLGGPLPAASQVLFQLTNAGLLGPLLVAIDVAIYVVLYWLAKRYWIGLLFAPILCMFSLNTLLVPILYMPLFQVISLVQ